MKFLSPINVNIRCKTFMSCSYVHEIRNHVHIIGLQNRFSKKQLFLWKIGGLRTLVSLAACFSVNFQTVFATKRSTVEIFGGEAVSKKWFFVSNWNSRKTNAHHNICSHDFFLTYEYVVLIVPLEIKPTLNGTSQN